VVWSRDRHVIADYVGHGYNSVVSNGLHSPAPPRRLRVGVHHRRGVLRIRNFRKTDAGVYTCAVAGADHSANTTLRYQTEDEARAQLVATRAALSNDDGGPEVEFKLDIIRERLLTVDFSERPPRPPHLFLASYSVWSMIHILVSWSRMFPNYIAEMHIG